MTIVDRETCCFLSIRAVWQRSQQAGQQMVNEAPAQQYYSDRFPLYDSLVYRKGYHLSLSDKSETYSVEGDNAELRHYLTRLVRRTPLFLPLPPLVESALEGIRACLESETVAQQGLPV